MREWEDEVASAVKPSKDYYSDISRPKFTINDPTKLGNYITPKRKAISELKIHEMVTDQKAISHSFNYCCCNSCNSFFRCPLYFL